MRLAFEDKENLRNFVSCKDINPSGISRFAYSPLINATNIHYSMMNGGNPLDFVDTSNDLSNYVISSCVNHSPDDWTGYNDKVKSLFEYLNEKYLSDLRSGRAVLLLDQSFEGYQTHWLWDFFHEHCKRYDVPPQSIIYVTGNMIVDDVYNKWADENGITERIKVVGYTHFELDVSMTTYNRSKTDEPLPSWEKHLEYKSNNNIKTFGCLNKRIRPHRVWFYNYMKDSNVMDNGLVSMNTIDEHDYPFEGLTLSTSKVQQLNRDLPMLVYGKKNNELDDNFYIRRFNDDVNLDTYITVVSEAHCGDSDQTMFLSEKLFKPIACNHPFIVMGNRDSLKMMRKLGYKTFNDYLDETYDELPTHERLTEIISVLRDIEYKDKFEWFKSMEEVVKHNYNNLIDKLQRPPDAFVEVDNYVKEYFSKII